MTSPNFSKLSGEIKISKTTVSGIQKIFRTGKPGASRVDMAAIGHVGTLIFWAASQTAAIAFSAFQASSVSNLYTP